MREPNRTTVNVLWEIGAERERQTAVEGWSTEHDDTHTDGELAAASACYAMHAVRRWEDDPPHHWPWSRKWWKPKDRRRDLVRAAAICLSAGYVKCILPVRSYAVFRFSFTMRAGRGHHFSGSAMIGPPPFDMQTSPYVVHSYQRPATRIAT